MVSKWERGEKRPSRLYRDLLALLYEAPATSLGIVPAARSAPDAAGAAAVDSAFAETPVGATAILDELGRDGAPVPIEERQPSRK